MKATLLTRRVVLFLVISAAPLLAQLANNTVTVTASPSSAAQPDEALFSVTVGSALDKSMDVVAVVSGLGITAANLVGISTPPSIFGGLPASSLGWTFQLAVPFSNTKDTTSALTALQKSIAK